jgi:hypothetical protein
MATSRTKNGAPIVDAAFEQASELNQQTLEAAREAGNLYLDSYEKVVDRAIELEFKVAAVTQHEWLKGLIEAQAELARELAESYTTAARSLLK